METIFKQLEKARKAIAEDPGAYDELRKETLADLSSFIYSDAWWGEKGKDFAEQYLGYEDERICKKLGLKPSSVRSN